MAKWIESWPLSQRFDLICAVIEQLGKTKKCPWFSVSSSVKQNLKTFLSPSPHQHNLSCNHKDNSHQALSPFQISLSRLQSPRPCPWTLIHTEPSSDTAFSTHTFHLPCALRDSVNGTQWAANPLSLTFS